MGAYPKGYHNKVKHFYYHLYTTKHLDNGDEMRVPYMTKCLVTDGKRWARGTAVCSVNDNFCKKTGRKIAFNRAMVGFFSMKDQKYSEVNPALLEHEEKFYLHVHTNG